ASQHTHSDATARLILPRSMSAIVRPNGCRHKAPSVVTPWRKRSWLASNLPCVRAIPGFTQTLKPTQDFDELAVWGGDSGAMSDRRHCGQPIPRGARTCGYCGAPVRGRPSVLMMTTVLVLLCLVTLGVAFFLLAGRSSEQQGAAVDQHGDDFVWLDTAMKQC